MSTKAPQDPVQVSKGHFAIRYQVDQHCIGTCQVHLAHIHHVRCTLFNSPLIDVGELHVSPPQAAFSVDALGHRVERNQLHAVRVRVPHLSQHLADTKRVKHHKG